MWGKRNAYGVLAGKPEAKRLLGRTGSRWECNIKNDPSIDGKAGT
jgi:hypothetical protein